MFSGVPQGSILSPLLFNIIFISFITNSSHSSCAVDNTLYASGQKLEEIKQIVHYNFEKVTKWFYGNYMVLNQGKCHLCALEEILKTKHLFLKAR